MEQSKFYQIKNITEHEYTLVGCDGNVITRPIQDVDKSASVFTIEDAKEGDILVSGEVIFIFNKIHDVWINCLCSLHKDGSFIEEDYDLMTIKYGKEVYPATKEQREQLFQKMEEAGYEWDAKKKELKKIEQHPTAWSEEDEKIIKRIDSLLYSQCTIHGSEYESIHNWLKSFRHNHWKPSEQNIKDLEWCADLAKDKMGVGFHRLQVFIDEIKNL